MSKIIRLNKQAEQTLEILENKFWQMELESEGIHKKPTTGEIIEIALKRLLKEL